MPTADTIIKIAFIGFGEAASAFVQGWGKGSHNRLQLSGYDIKLSASPDIRTAKLGDFSTCNVSACESASTCAKDADVVFSMVTADQALQAAQSVSETIGQNNSLYFDCNSCAPDTKRQAATIINSAGGRYVDVAVMSPVHPKLHKSPVLVSGQSAQIALDMMARLDMEATLQAGEVGTASSIKMIRSVMIKGMEALVAECVLAGRKAGVEDIVLDSLEKTYPGFGWKSRSAYMLERMMVHGKRRAAEMREVALCVEQLGLNNAMANATVEWQQSIGDMQLDAGEDDHHARADAIIAALDAD